MHQDIFLQIRARLLIRINSLDIFHIEAEDQYAKITTATATHRINIALSRLESLLPEDLFCRVNRSFIVSIYHISRIEEDVVLVKEKEITIGKKYRDLLITRLKVVG
jgi:two-component system LytT family response regulator